MPHSSALRSFCISLLTLILFHAAAWGQQSSAYDRYVSQYRAMAVEQMYKYGVPASITLAQGLLESGAGQSMLATRANNHFGIKVSGSWTGPYVLMTDDAPNEKFRAYRNAAESYEDHSRFLAGNRRYAALFRLSRTDYKGWARGLQSAGYATNPRYATMLISIIERYNLHRYDKFSRKQLAAYVKDSKRAVASTADGAERQVLRCNGTYYVVAREGDSYASIARWAGSSEKRLCRYNEVPRGAVLRAGDVVFLHKKKSKAARRLRGTYYEVRQGDSMHSIAQSYGMRLSTLYELNQLSPDATLSVGDRLRIR